MDLDRPGASLDEHATAARRRCVGADDPRCRRLAAVMVHAALRDALENDDARAYVLETAAEYVPGAFGWWALACGLCGEVLAERLRRAGSLDGIAERGLSNALRR